MSKGLVRSVRSAVAAASLCLALGVAAMAQTVGGAAARSNSAPVQAQHLTAQLVAARDTIHPGSTLDAGLYLRLEPGWHVYWSNAGDSGEPPQVRWTLPEGVTADDLQFPAPKRLPLGPLMDYGYENEVLFPITLHADANAKLVENAEASAKVSWLVCREVCLPGKAELKLPLNVADMSTPGKAMDADLIALAKQGLPKPLPAGATAVFQPVQGGFTLAVLTGKSESSAQFFPFDQSQIANAAPQAVTALHKGLRIDLKKDENLTAAPAELHGLLVLADGTAYDVHAVPGKVPAAPAVAGSVIAILRVAGLAFLGGAILNLMPCVFPVLFLKGLALVQSSGEERRRMRAHGWVYTLGVVASFWVVVALLLVLRGAGRHLGWGFQFQSPGFIAVIAMLLFFLGLSLAGMFEIGLTLTSAGGSLAAKQGYAGSFFTGVLAMVVATPCTAPFMGTAIGYALAQPAVVTFVVFTALGLGLAAPYLLLTLNPVWTRLLPKPGAWMEVLKQATAVPIFATVIYMVWLFVQAAGANALFDLLGAFLLLAIAGWVLGRWPAKRVPGLVAAAIVLAAVAIPIYSTRNATGETAQAAASAGPKTWEPFTPELVEKYRAQGRPVLVDFTASWCLSCQVNERVVLDRADVQQRLQQSGVALVRADWTHHDESIAQALAALGRSGVPTYVVYPAGGDPQVLPEVLTPGIVFEALDRLKQTAQAGTPAR